MTAPTIPGFQLVKLLGSGGFAEVFLYEQQWPQQKVAIKVVRPDVPLTGAVLLARPNFPLSTFASTCVS